MAYYERLNIKDIFQEEVFTDEVMQRYMSEDAYRALKDVIARGDELHTDPARCIRCCACVKGCAFGARTFETPFAAVLSRNFARRKPPVTLM